MAKIGTAHIEIKPVINEEALEALVQRIEDAVAAGVARGMAGTTAPPVVNIYSTDPEVSKIEVAAAIANARRQCAERP